MLVNWTVRCSVLCWGPKIFSLTHSWDHFTAGFAQVLWEHGVTDGWNTEMETERNVSIRATVINSSAQENMEHSLSQKLWKRPCCSSSTKADLYLTERSWDLAKCYPQFLEQLLYWWCPSDNLPVTAWLRVANSFLLFVAGSSLQFGRSCIELLLS